MLVSEDTFSNLKTSTAMPPLEMANIKLCTYIGEEIETLGSLQVTVEKNGQKYSAAFGSGRNWPKSDWTNLLEHISISIAWSWFNSTVIPT